MVTSMAVNVSISASAGGAVDAIKQLQSAIQKAGESAKAFKDLDLSKPELSGMADDVRRLSARFEDLGRIGRGNVSAAYRAVQNANGGNYTDPLSWEHGLDRAFPDPHERERHRQSVLRYATAGTRWAQPMAPAGGGGGGVPPGGPSAAPVPGGGGGGAAPASTLGTMAAGALGGLGIAAGVMALGMVKEFAVRSVGLARDEATGTDDLYRHTDLTQTFNELRDSIMATTKGLGVTAQEAGALALSFAKVTGQTDAATIATNVRMGTGLGRSFGMDPGLATQALGQATVAGLDPAKFAVLVGEAAGKGGRSADETMPALLRLAEAATRSLVTHSNELETASMLAGFNAMGLPGFRGANAEAMMNTLGSSISQGGNAGVASAAVSYRVGQRQGVTDPYDLKMLQEGGLFANAKADLGYGSGESNFQARLAELQREYAGQPQNRLLNAMENDLGINMRQGRELLRYKPSDLSTTFTALQGAHLNLSDLNPTAIGDTVRIANAGQGDLEGLRQQMLNRHGQGTLSPEDQRALADSGPDSLRGSLLQMAAKYGQSETEGSKTRDAMSELSNSLTVLGRSLITPLNDLASIEGTLVTGVSTLTDTLIDVYKAGKGDPEAADRLTFGKGSARAGGGEAPLTDAASKEREAQLMAFYQSPEGGGWTRNQAAGLTANAMAESGGRAHGPAGDSGLAQGLYQWHPDRVAAIEKQFGKKLADMDWKEQAAAKNWELSQFGPEAAAGAAIRATTSAAGAGYADTVYDQRPAGAWLRGASRGAAAEGITHPGMIPGPIQIAPLEVIHKDTSGNILGTQSLPVTDVGSPTPHGPPRAGKSATPPPPPPPPAMGSAAWWGIS